MLRVSDFTEMPAVFHLISELKSRDIHKKEFSDIIDDDGNQYVDLVQEGGGVLGAALLGYTYVMEQVGIRFLSLVGTSAGAINTMVMAAMGVSKELKSPRMIEILANVNVANFIDGDANVQKFIKNFVSTDGNRFALVWSALRASEAILDDFGLNPGAKFEAWIEGILADFGITSTENLLAKFKIPSYIRLRENSTQSIEGLTARLAIVAADITTETKIIFPEMRSLYWHNSEQINPARYVRASMAIPLFFKPVRITDLPKGSAALKNWFDLVKYKGEIPDEVLLVDGGIMSNFPIGLLHRQGIPRNPTFGVRLGARRSEYNQTDGIFAYMKAIFNATRHVHDFDFILRNKDYQKVIEHIDTGHHNWLNFEMTDADQKDLFLRGATAAANFLTKFNWEEYKKIRAVTTVH